DRHHPDPHPQPARRRGVQLPPHVLRVQARRRAAERPVPRAEEAADPRNRGRARMRITFAPWGETLAELADAARRAEAAGAEVIWLQELHRSASISAAALIQATSTAQVGTAIQLAFTRSPMVTALEAMDLD